ncbi:class I SAM-dependent methyltransferase [Wenzhouxiangella sp. XN79A]|uniref:class I SAM-dependent methyltransferase n=1 Tax=Wenzhouxiangella sp. XN79A TaxID=2724193 RepID=UPI00144A864F|nr:class I SAM-dependent methyltransferase [Wenzhouxiangella sp. XN79A]NKI36079.1 class I SAM-dependent methyltransferase [Wenzhouxiangella sp. XN79A]
MAAQPAPGSDDALEFTGERFTPECVREIVYEHWHRYAWARGLVRDKDVLDCACGEGYGSHLLADAAKSVVGVDVDPKAVAHARRRYSADHLSFQQADALDLPFDENRFDVVVSFETLEHLAEHDDLLAGFRRVLKPDGVLLLSSPDKRTYSDLTGYDNEFHVRELYRDELEALLGRHFPNYRLSGQKLMFHSLVWALDDDAPTGAEHLTADDDRGVSRDPRPHVEPLYFLAMAAGDGVDLPAPPALSLFTDTAESVYAHYNDEVARHIRAGELLAEREREIERLRERLADLERGADSPWTRLRRWLTGR